MKGLVKDHSDWRTGRSWLTDGAICFSADLAWNGTLMASSDQMESLSPFTVACVLKAEKKRAHSFTIGQIAIAGRIRLLSYSFASDPALFKDAYSKVANPHPLTIFLDATFPLPTISILYIHAPKL